MSLPISLAHLKWKISEKKCPEAKGVGGYSEEIPTLPAGENDPKRGPVLAKSNKRLAARLYHLKTGHCLACQHLKWTKNKHTVNCWRSPCNRTQTREHLFKNLLPINIQRINAETGRRRPLQPRYGQNEKRPCVPPERFIEGPHRDPQPNPQMQREMDELRQLTRDLQRDRQQGTGNS